MTVLLSWAGMHTVFLRSLGSYHMPCRAIQSKLLLHF